MESERSKAIWELGRLPLVELNERLMRAMGSDPHSKLPGIAGIVFRLSKYLGEFARPDADAKRAIVLEVVQTRLIATGIRTLPTRSREAVRIDADDFGRGQVSWALGRYVNGDFRYDDVRLTRASRLPEPLKSSHPNAGARTAVINHLITQLFRAGRITNKPNKSNVAVLKTEIEKHDIRYGGMSDDNLRRVLRGYFKTN